MYIYTVIRRGCSKKWCSVVQANTHRLTGQKQLSAMFWNVSRNHCIYLPINTVSEKDAKPQQSTKGALVQYVFYDFLFSTIVG